MPALRRFDVDELLTRPGTYFNPETEIVLIVDDSAHVDLELLGDEEDDAAEWILLGDDPAIDEHKRDELVEAFETRRARSSDARRPGRRGRARKRKSSSPTPRCTRSRRPDHARGRGEVGELADAGLGVGGQWDLHALCGNHHAPQAPFR